ncbi:MAG: hypothetical protein CMO81_04750 [Waddliaceae bacterium]|nr:hypothetical protein [Waddliaceae bacterium]
MQSLEEFLDESRAMCSVYLLQAPGRGASVVMHAYDHLMGAVSKFLSERDLRIFAEALEYIAFQLQKSLREDKNSSPALIHSIRTLDHLVTFAEEKQLLVLLGALFYSSQSSVDLSFSEICSRFGEEYVQFLITLRGVHFGMVNALSEEQKRVELATCIDLLAELVYLGRKDPDGTWKEIILSRIELLGLVEPHLDKECSNLVARLK